MRGVCICDEDKEMIDDLHVHIANLRRYAYVLCRNPADADDLVQETLVKAIAAAHTYRPGHDLRAWLFGILHNSFLSHRRQFARRARAATFLSAPPAADGGDPSPHERSLDAHYTLRMLSRLTPDQQAALILIAVEGLSYEEAAEMLEVPVGTLMSRLARGRERLRQLIGESSNRLKAVR
jgi:RNA polymerase sigma-70 factor (ECF subfamily)